MDSARVQAFRKTGGLVKPWQYTRLPRDLGPAKPPHYLRWEDHFAPTDQGLLFIKRIFRDDGAPPTADSRLPPVILFPPFGCNGNFFRTTTRGEVLTIDTTDSFANFLASIGRDVYVVHPSYTDRIYRRYVMRFPQLPYEFHGPTSFHTLVERDVPAAIAYVRRATDSPHVDWVGHSMGGVVMYAYLGLHPDAPVRRVVAIGAPIEFGDIFVYGVALYNAIFAKGLGLAERSPLGLASELIAPITWMLSHVPGEVLRYVPVLRYLFYPPNTNPAVVTALFRKVIENPGAPLTLSFADWIYDRRFSYRDNMRNIRTPFLLIYGDHDNIAPPRGVLRAREAMPHAEVRVRKVKGAGHADLTLGKKAKETVWAATAQFLSAAEISEFPADT